MRDALLAHGFGSAERMRDVSVLEVGSGTGTNLAWLLELGADPKKCTGIDVMAESVGVAKERLPGVRFFVGDFSTTDVGGPFDVVMIIAVLTSIKDPALKRAMMKKCFSLVRPGGMLFFYDYMIHGEDPGSENYKRISYKEFDEYTEGRKVFWHKRDLLKASFAESLVPRFGVVAAEVVQALGVFNIEGSFAYIPV